VGLTHLPVLFPQGAIKMLNQGHKEATSAVLGLEGMLRQLRQAQVEFEKAAARVNPHQGALDM